jgi:ubiquinone/menaquinone biosynthesis C-methylase UbiE
VTSTESVAGAYSAVAEAWTGGPSRLYDRLADVLVGASTVPLRGASVLDLGSGTGAGSRAALAVGARVVAVDLAIGMLRVDQGQRPPATVGDLRALPFASGTFDVALAPFSLNHLVEPAAGVSEAARVIRSGGMLLASTYAADDDHPARAAVDQALRDLGWRPPAWYLEVKAAMTSWGTVDRATAAIERGGMEPRFVEYRCVGFPELGTLELVAWRLGMAHTAPFVGQLAPRERDGLVERSVALLGAHPTTLIRRVLLIGAT